MNYALLADLNTQPRTTYLAALRNPNPALEESTGAPQVPSHPNFADHCATSKIPVGAAVDVLNQMLDEL